MFRALLVTLQREFAPRFYHDAFDLVAIASIESLIPAPRSVHTIMLERLRASILLELLDNELDVFGVLLRRYQHGIICGYHHDVLKTHQSDARMITVGESAARIVQQNFCAAMRHILVFILGKHFPDRRP